MSATADRTTIYLLRHARSDASPEVPESLWPLSSLGMRQADALVPVLQALPIDAIYCSPYLRAQQTVAPFADAAGLTVQVEEGLHERALPWTGELDAFLSLTRRCFEQPDFTPEGDEVNRLPQGSLESNHQCSQRMSQSVGRLLERHRGQRLLLSGHGVALTMYMHTLDQRFGYETWRSMDNPDLFRVVVGADNNRVGAVERIALHAQPGEADAT